MISYFVREQGKKYKLNSSTRIITYLVFEIALGQYLHNGSWWGYHYVGYNHSFYWDIGTNYEITSTTTTTSGKLVLMFVRQWSWEYIAT
jgi:hypothetical protein